MSIKLGIQVARTILTGDVQLARSLAAGRRSWSVAEARAIAGACREVSVRWNANLTFTSFCV